jgi:hypothetical protein
MMSIAIAQLNYAWTLFVGVPYFIGFFTTVVLRFWSRVEFRVCYRAAAVAAGVFALAGLVFGFEGLICMLLALPLALPLVVLGAWMGYAALHRADFVDPTHTGVFLILALAGALWAEGRQRWVAPIFTVSDSVTISVPSDAVWSSLIGMGPLGQPKDLLFRMGVACPQRVDIYGTGEGAMRVCTLSTGQLHERITAWEPGRLLRWDSISTPPPLKELNPFVDTDPPHLHGFYRSVGGQFELQSLGPERTQVTRSSSYQHQVFPAAYWRIWSDYVASRGHVHVLGVLKQSAEGAVVARNIPAQ